MYTCPDDSMHSAYADGELDAKSAAEYEAHVKTCARCAARLAQYRALREVFREDSARCEAECAARGAGFTRLELKLAYKEHALGAGARGGVPRGIRYFAAGIAAAAAIAFVVPGGISRRAEDARAAGESVAGAGAFTPVPMAPLRVSVGAVRADGALDAGALADEGVDAPAGAGAGARSRGVAGAFGDGFGAPGAGVLWDARADAMRRALTSYDVFAARAEFDREAEDARGFAGADFAGGVPLIITAEGDVLPFAYGGFGAREAPGAAPGAAAVPGAWGGVRLFVFPAE